MKVSFNFYYKRKYWLARVIRWATNGRFNHVSVTIDGVTWEAIGGRMNAVVASHSPTAYHKGKHAVDSLTVVELDPEAYQAADAALAKERLKALEGHKYDQQGVMAFLFPAFRFSKRKYFCTDVAAEVFTRLSGNQFADKLITPSELYDVIRNSYLAP